VTMLIVMMLKVVVEIIRLVEIMKVLVELRLTYNEVTVIRIPLNGHQMFLFLPFYRTMEVAINPDMTILSMIQKMCGRKTLNLTHLTTGLCRPVVCSSCSFISDIGLS